MFLSGAIAPIRSCAQFVPEHLLGSGEEPCGAMAVGPAPVSRNWNCGGYLSSCVCLNVLLAGDAHANLLCTGLDNILVRSKGCADFWDQLLVDTFIWGKQVVRRSCEQGH